MTVPFLHMSRRTMAGSLLIPIILILCARWLRAQSFNTVFFVNLATICLFFLVAIYLIQKLHARSADWLDSSSVDTTDYLDRIPSRYIGWAIVGASGLSLYLELIIIRWQSTMFSCWPGPSFSPGTGYTRRISSWNADRVYGVS